MLCAAPLAAQDSSRILASQPNAWFNYFGDHAVSRRWGLHLEGQWRRHGPVDDWMQLLLRPGINYYVNPNVMLSGGYAFIRTYPYGEFPVATAFPEHRFWQQALIRHRPAAKLAMQHRYRLEQRNLGVMSVHLDGPPRRTSYRFENRFRYLVRGDIQLTEKNGRPDWYLAAYNEIMVNFGRNVGANIFDQNRAYLAAGKSLRNGVRLEAGYMNQLLQQRNGRIFELNHTIMVSLFSSIRFRN